MIALTPVRTLTLAMPSAPGRPAHLSAASGLVCAGSNAYVIADDEMHVGVFRIGAREPGRLVRIFDGMLPDAHKPRKKAKPDIEAIALLPGSHDHPHGALLVLGSGSRPNRQRGAILSLDAHGEIDGPPRVIDISAVYAALAHRFAEINIEGAAIAGGQMLLFQRGNVGYAGNAVITFSLPAFLNAVAGTADGIEPARIDSFDLGTIDNIPLSFTDAAALPDGRVLFTAVAEDTDNAYDDGRCAGAVLGIISGSVVQRVEPFDPPCKVEGVSARVNGNAIELLLVTDADNADIAGELFSAALDL